MAPQNEDGDQTVSKTTKHKNESNSLSNTTIHNKHPQTSTHMHSLCGQGPALATQRLLRKYAQMKARILKYTWNYGMIYHLVGRATNKSGGSYSDLGNAH